MHAIGITSNVGTQLLLHIGLDTYDLKGKPFKLKVKLNDFVRCGDPLMSVNITYIKEHGLNPIVPIISTNKKIQPIKTQGRVKAGEVLFQIEE